MVLSLKSSSGLGGPGSDLDESSRRAVCQFISRGHIGDQCRHAFPDFDLLACSLVSYYGPMIVTVEISFNSVVVLRVKDMDGKPLDDADALLQVSVW